MRFIWAILLFLSPLLVNSDNLDSMKAVLRGISNDSLRIERYVTLGYNNFRDPANALQLVSDMISYSDSIKDQRTRAFCLRKIGVLYGKMNYYDKAMEYTFMAAGLFGQVNDKEGLANCYNNIGNFYNSKAEFTGNEMYLQNSVDYHLRCIKLRKSFKDSIQLHNSYNNIGNAYKSMGKLKQALEYYEMAYPVYLAKKDDNGLQMCLLNFGDAYLKMGLREHKTEYLKIARGFYQKLYDKYHDQEMLSDRHAECLSKLGLILFETGNKDRGLEFMSEGYEIAVKIKNKNAIKDASEILAKYYEKSENDHLALRFLHIYNDMVDSLVNAKSKTSAEQMQALYKATEKDKEIEKLNNEKKIKDEKLRRSRIVTIATVLGLLLVLVLALVIFSRYNLKKKANEQLTDAYNKIELKNRQITDSINYAKRIQSAILPPEEILKNNFRNFFLFFSPRDIVSGDFYWFSEQDGKKFFAVADCTGHGVPGALMSMIGNTLLHEIVNQKNITDPGEILVHLDSEISLALRQNNNDVLTQDDGMDISIVCLDPSKPDQLIYACANHSIFVKEQNEVKQLEGDIYSIGGSIGKDHRSFQSKIYPLRKKSVIVMSSDGYYDQFGGPKDHKFLTSNFEKLISNSDFENSNASEIFKNNFLQWKGSHKQTDDVLVAGFSV